LLGLKKHGSAFNAGLLSYNEYGWPVVFRAPQTLRMSWLTWALRLVAGLTGRAGRSGATDTRRMTLGEREGEARGAGSAVTAGDLTVADLRSSHGPSSI
jgi:hypothetical protein